MNKLYPSDVQKLREELAECQKELDEHLRNWNRVVEERNGLVMALEYVKQSVFENSEAFDIANTALAKVGKTGEGS